MAKSFRKIDYRVRPAKSVERKMMAEVFARMREFRSLESFRYVGLGSVYFSDFLSFYAACGFTSMISIEGTTDQVEQRRFLLNIPHDHIELIFGHTNAVLPKLDYAIPSVIWLDFDGVLNKSVCNDVMSIAFKSCSPTFIAVSVNTRLSDDQDGLRNMKEVLRSRLEDAAPLPPEYEAGNKTIKGKDVPSIFRDILDGIVSAAVAQRNAGKSQGHRIKYEQILFFTYEDGAPMLTLGWMLYDEGQEASYRKCNFSALTFFRSSNSSFHIDTPLLTAPETRLLDRLEQGVDIPVPVADKENYLRLKRYWPQFASLSS